jgi:hypothetical protein
MLGGGGVLKGWMRQTEGTDEGPSRAGGGGELRKEERKRGERERKQGYMNEERDINGLAERILNLARFNLDSE